MKTGMNLLLWTDQVTEAARRAPRPDQGARLRRGRDPDLRHDRPGPLRAAGQAAQEPGPGRDGRDRDGRRRRTRSRPTRKIRDAAVAHLDRVLECGQRSAARSSAARSTRPSASSPATGRPRTSSSTASRRSQRAAEKAQARGIKMAIEYLNRFEIYFLTTAAQTVRFVRAVNHPYCKMMYDSFHAHIEEKDQAAGDRLVRRRDDPRPRLGERPRHARHRAGPLGRLLLGGLKQTGYDGYLTIEAFGRALPALAAATRVWRDLFPDAMGLCRDGPGLHQVAALTESRFRPKALNRP